MKLLLHFLRPYWKLCLMVLLSVTVDVTGALLVPTITADMINLLRGHFLLIAVDEEVGFD